MLGKIMKHELKDTARIIPFLYLIAILVAAMGLIAKQADISWFKISSSIVLILVGIAIVAVTFVIVIMRYYKSLYTSEGYLAFTLPVKPHLHLVSKSIISVAWVLISMAIFVGSMFMAFYILGVFNSSAFQVIFDQINAYNLETPIVWMAIMIILSVIYLISQIFFSITLSNVPAFHGMGGAGAIVIFLILNVALKILETVFTVLIPFSVSIGDEGLSLTTRTMLGSIIDEINGGGSTNFGVIGLGGYIFAVIAIGLLFYLNGRFMNKKVSLR